MTATTIRLTASQALLKYLMAQKVELASGQITDLCGGVFAIFGHGNVAGIGEALYSVKDSLPTYRGHNEQGMAFSAIAYAKAHNRQRFMACTTSVGPGATNLVTAAALAHVNRLPVLFLPGDTFAGRLPDPVLQQVENFGDATVSANDCFKPVSRYFDRITRPEQLITSLPAAIQVLTDPALCGPVTLAMPQDVQTMAYDFPLWLFEDTIHRTKRPGPDLNELERIAQMIQEAERPLLIAGGGVHYSHACDTLKEFVTTHKIPVAETQAGKGALPWDHPYQVGALGVTGGSAANELAQDADLIVSVGSRLSDFTTGSRSLFNPNARLINLNITPFDGIKYRGYPLICDAKRGLEELQQHLGPYTSSTPWQAKIKQKATDWNQAVDGVIKDDGRELPTDAQILGAVFQHAAADSTVVAAAGGLPGEMHKLWRCQKPGSYHMEYGYSCMGYEIAGGLGVKMAKPDSDVYVMVGDGSYMMLNSEIATSVMLDQKMVIVVCDNRGFSCISRLQQSLGGQKFNNHLDDCLSGENGAPTIDFKAHAQSLGAQAEQVNTIKGLKAALGRAAQSPKTYVIVVDSDPITSTEAGGHWWDVAVAETSEEPKIRAAFETYQTKTQQRAEARGKDLS